MGPQYTLDITCGDTVVITTRTATFRVDCHRMDAEWSLLLRYRADTRCPAACDQQSPKNAGDRRPLQDKLPEEESSLPEGSDDLLTGTENDATRSAETQAGVAVDDLVADQTAETLEPVEFGVIRKLGDLPPDAVISEDGLAKLFGRCRTSIKRAVRRGELPPSVRMFGGSVWTVEALRNHMNKRLEAADKESKRLQQRISRLRP